LDQPLLAIADYAFNCIHCQQVVPVLVDPFVRVDLAFLEDGLDFPVIGFV
jgi:hypothetical protein